MTRRTALLALLAMPIGNMQAWSHPAQVAARNLPGLRIDLDLYKALLIQHQGKTIVLTAAEIFAALQGE